MKLVKTLTFKIYDLDNVQSAIRLRACYTNKKPFSQCLIRAKVTSSQLRQLETYENFHTNVTQGSYCETEGTQTPFITLLGRKSKGVESEKQI